TGHRGNNARNRSAAVDHINLTALVFSERVNGSSGCEQQRGGAAVEAKYLAGAEVAVDISSLRQRSQRATVNVPADYGATVQGVSVFQVRKRQAWRNGGIDVGAVIAFEYSPTIIGAGRDDIRFPPGVLPDVADVKSPGRAIERKPPRVPQSISIHFRRCVG